MLGDIGPLVPLLRSAAAGDAAALEELLTRLYPGILGYQRRWMGRHRERWATPEDLAQEAMCRIAQAIGECRADTPEQLLGWAVRVARNVGYDHLRARQRDPIVAARELTDAVLLAEVDEPAPPGALLELLRREYDRLPARTQEILWLRVIEGATWRELARDLGSTLRGTQRRFQRFQAATQAAARRAGVEWPGSTPG